MKHMLHLMRSAEDDGLLEAFETAAGAGERMPLALSCSSATCNECGRARVAVACKHQLHLLESLAQSAFALGQRLAQLLATVTRLRHLKQALRHTAKFKP
jgi:hypothetical protein